MIEYVHSHNPDDRIIRRVADVLRDGGLVAYPTDSSWAIGCSSESSKGFDRLSRLRADKKTRFSLICSSISQMSELAQMDTPSFRLVKQHTPGPYVFILDTLHKVEKKIGVKRPEIGLRIPSHPIPVKLVETLGAPMFSITAAKDMVDIYNESHAAYTEELLFETGWELEDIEEIDVILDTGEVLEKRLSTVVRLTADGPELLRQGKAAWPKE